MPVKNIKELKIQLRARYRRIRETMEPSEKSRQDGEIARRIWGMREYQKADRLFTYVSKPIEVDTAALIDRGLEEGKMVIVPRCGSRDL